MKEIKMNLVMLITSKTNLTIIILPIILVFYA